MPMLSTYLVADNDKPVQSAPHCIIHNYLESELEQTAGQLAPDHIYSINPFTVEVHRLHGGCTTCPELNALLAFSFASLNNHQQ